MSEFLPYRTHMIPVTQQASPLSAYWEDLRFPATAINPPGAIDDPDREFATGLLLFDADATEVIFALAQMPHGWREGTAVRPHVHWQKTTSASGNVHWTLQYKKSPIGEVMAAKWTTLTASESAITDNDTANEHLLTPLGSIDCTGMTVSDCILFRIARTGGNEADTYAADARLLEFDVHYQVSSPGSRKEFVK